MCAIYRIAIFQLTINRLPKGFLWVGTANGLLRYDGLRAKLYRNEATNPGSLKTFEMSKSFN